MLPLPSAGYRITLRAKYKNVPGMLGRVTTAIGEAGGDINAIDIVDISKGFIIRDFTINARDQEHERRIIEAVRQVEGVDVLHVSDRVFLIHLGGKIEVVSKVPLKTRDDLSMAYTPGVARVCQAIYQDSTKVFNLTIKRNTVAVVTDGTAVLGLGDIGPEAALPVMEGKALLFKEFGGVNAFPLCLNTKDVEEIVETVKRLAPVFGGINLEDISAPRCFEIEERLTEELDIPVFHDDQHGTAVVVMAALINALKIVGKKMEDLRVAVSGAGAAGVACVKMFLNSGIRQIYVCDRQGIIYRGRPHLTGIKQWLAEKTNPENRQGTLKEALVGADLFLGVSGPGLLKGEDLKVMAKDAIVFALANPVPEVLPEEAWFYARVVATGRSDYPNQINNVLCFPGFFRGLLEARASKVTEGMKIAAARAIANIVQPAELDPEYIVPSVFNREVAPAVAGAVIASAQEEGVARRVPSSTAEAILPPF